MLYIVCGPTGSGKTSVAKSLADFYHAPIINADAFHEYWKSVVSALDREIDPSILASSIHRLPDVVDAKKADIIGPEDWPVVAKALNEALDQLMSYRATEGKALYGTSAYGSAAAAFPHLVYGGIL